MFTLDGCHLATFWIWKFLDAKAQNVAERQLHWRACQWHQHEHVDVYRSYNILKWINIRVQTTKNFGAHFSSWRVKISSFWPKQTNKQNRTKTYTLTPTQRIYILHSIHILYTNEFNLTYSLKHVQIWIKAINSELYLNMCLYPLIHDEREIYICLCIQYTFTHKWFCILRIHTIQSFTHSLKIRLKFQNDLQNFVKWSTKLQKCYTYISRESIYIYNTYYTHIPGIQYKSIFLVDIYVI